jgi:hypothetical protein
VVGGGVGCGVARGVAAAVGAVVGADGGLVAEGIPGATPGVVPPPGLAPPPGVVPPGVVPPEVAPPDVVRPLTPPDGVVPVIPAEVVRPLETPGMTLATGIADAAMEEAAPPAGAADTCGARTRPGAPGPAGLGIVPDRVPTITRAITRPRPIPMAVWRYIGSDRSRGTRRRNPESRSTRADFRSVRSDADLGSNRPRRPMCVILLIGLLLTSTPECS